MNTAFSPEEVREIMEYLDGPVPTPPQKVIYEVKCAGCGEIFHHTTDAFNIEAIVDGTMFELLEPWKSNGWNDFFKNADYHHENIRCPSCHDLYTTSEGYMRDILWPTKETVGICPVCFRNCTSWAGVLAHVSAKHPDKVKLFPQTRKNS